jgi:hypothetical protein
MAVGRFAAALGLAIAGAPCPAGKGEDAAAPRPVAQGGGADLPPGHRRPGAILVAPHPPPRVECLRGRDPALSRPARE